MGQSAELLRALERLVGTSRPISRVAIAGQITTNDQAGWRSSRVLKTTARIMDEEPMLPARRTLHELTEAFCPWPACKDVRGVKLA